MASSYQGFTVSQPFPGALLEFVPPLGTPELDQLIDQYIPGAQSMQEKRARVTIDFYEWSRLTGQAFKFYQVFESPASSSLADSPSSSVVFTDSSFGSSIEPSPIMPSWDSPASFSSVSTAPTVSHSSSRRRKPSRPSPRLSDFSDMPGMRILTQDGVDVTNSASRGCKTKEQRDHAHMMRIMKACESCKRRKIKCDPSHRSRPQTQAATQARTAALTRALAPAPASTAQPPSQPTAAAVSVSTPSTLTPTDDWLLDFSLPADDQMAALMRDFPISIPETDLLQGVSDDYDFVADPLGLLSGLDVTLPDVSSSAAKAQDSSTAARSTVAPQTTTPALPYMQDVPTSVYTDFNLYSPASDTLDDELDYRTLSSRDSISPVDTAGSQPLSPSSSHSASPQVSSARVSSPRSRILQKQQFEAEGANGGTNAVLSPTNTARLSPASAALVLSPSPAPAPLPAPVLVPAPSPVLASSLPCTPSSHHILVSAAGENLHIVREPALHNSQSHVQNTDQHRLRNLAAIEAIPADNDGCTSRQAVPTNGRDPQRMSSPRSEMLHGINHNNIVIDVGRANGLDTRPQDQVVTQSNLSSQLDSMARTGSQLHELAARGNSHIASRSADLQNCPLLSVSTERIRVESAEEHHVTQDHDTRGWNLQVSINNTTHALSVRVSVDVPASKTAAFAPDNRRIEDSTLERDETITSTPETLLEETVQSIPVSTGLVSGLEENSSGWTPLFLSLASTILWVIFSMACLVFQTLVLKQEPLGWSLLAPRSRGGTTTLGKASSDILKLPRAIGKARNGCKDDTRPAGKRLAHALPLALLPVSCV
jgi:hypothetical protein